MSDAGVRIEELEKQIGFYEATVIRGVRRINELEEQRDRLAAQNSALRRAVVAMASAGEET